MKQNTEKTDLLLDAIGFVGDDLIAEASGVSSVLPISSKVRLNFMILRRLAVAIACIMLVTALMPLSIHLYNNYISPSADPSGSVGESLEQTAPESQNGDVNNDTPTQEEKTDDAVPKVEPMQIPEGHYVDEQTEFPLIITLGGKEVEATLRAATLHTQLNTRSYYIDVLYEGKVIVSQCSRGAVQICATRETSSRFAIFSLPDNCPWYFSRKIQFRTLYVSDVDSSHGTPEVLEAPEFQWAGGINVGFAPAYEQEAWAESANRGMIRTLKYDLDKDIPQFEADYSKLCVVLDSFSDTEKDAKHQISDEAPLYDYAQILSCPYFLEIRNNYNDHELLRLTPDLFTKTILPLELPEGWTAVHEAIGGDIYEVYVDGVKYELISRMITVEKDGERALYLDLVDTANRKVLTSTVLEGYFRLYQDNVTQNECSKFILERFIKNSDGTVTVSTARYEFTDIVTDASGSVKSDFAFREVYNENNYSATVTLDPADSASAEKLAKLGKCTYELAEFYYNSTSYGIQAYSNSAKTYTNPISIAGDWYTYSGDFYTAQGLKDKIFEIK